MCVCNSEICIFSSSPHRAAVWKQCKLGSRNLHWLLQERLHYQGLQWFSRNLNWFTPIEGVVWERDSGGRSNCDLWNGRMFQMALYCSDYNATVFCRMDSLLLTEHFLRTASTLPLPVWTDLSSFMKFHLMRNQGSVDVCWFFTVQLTLGMLFIESV